MKKIISLLSTILLASTICSAQTYCGNEPLNNTVQNLVIRSEEFDNASWTKSGVTVTANTVTAPDGNLTADSVLETAATSAHYTYASAFNTTAGVPVRLCTSLKKLGRQYAQIATSTGAFGGTNLYANIDLDTGLVSASHGSITASVTNQLNGWYRLCVVATPTSTTTGLMLMGSVPGASDTGAFSFSGDITKGIYAWGAQVSLASSPDQYVTTTDAQVLAGSYGTVPKSYQSNLLLRSEEFDNAAWTKYNSTITANTSTAPDGTLTADRYAEAATSTTHAVYNAVALSGLSNSTSYRFSGYLKKEVINWARIAPSISTPINAWLNLTTCTFGTVETGLVATSSTVIDGWCKFDVRVTSDATTGYWQVYSTTADNVSSTHLGVITNTMLIWGAQVNLAAYPADYRRTSSSASTLGPLCPAGTSQSLIDPSRCFVVSTGNPLKLTPFQGNQTGSNIDVNQPPLTPYRGSSN